MAARLNLQIEVIAPDLGDYLRSFTPVDTGKLRDSWSVFHPTETTWIATNVQPYAAIQQFGGYIPPVEGKLMVANFGGQTTFFTSRKGFYIAAQHYIEPAINAFVEQIRIRWK